MNKNEVTFTTSITTDPRFPGEFTVETHVGGIKLDRDEVMGYMLPDTSSGRKMAQRLRRAIEAGAAFRPTEVLTDIEGQTYLGCKVQVWGKYMNSCLKELGF